MRWYLIGFMGVGKSTHGRNLAYDLDLAFVDLDKEIAAAEGASVEDVFASHGEPYFRKIEYEILMSVSKRYDDAVISTGGGLPCQGRNMEILKALGKTIYLHAPAEALVRRLQSSSGKRPLLAGKSPMELQSYVEELMSVRDPIYRRAELMIDLDLSQEIGTNRAKLLKEVRSLGV